METIQGLVGLLELIITFPLYLGASVLNFFYGILAEFLEIFRIYI